MNILITSAGQRVSLVRAFQRELKLRYPGAKVLTADIQPELSAACNISDQFVKISRATDPNHGEELLAICRDHKISMVIPTIDTELWAISRCREEFEKDGIHLIVSSLPFVDLCRDKRKTAAFFQRNNIEIPEQYDRDHLEFPLFIKPYDGSLSADTHVVLAPTDLTPLHLKNEKFLFMEYIDRESHHEFTVDAYYSRDGDLKCLVPRKRIWVRAGEVNKGLTCKNEIMDLVKKNLSRIEGARGCLTIQFFMNFSSKRIIGIEINPRFGGGFPLSYQAGANYPGWLIEEYLQNKTFMYTDTWENNLLMLRYDDEVLVHDYSN